jgi:hypothetical protein
MRRSVLLSVRVLCPHFERPVTVQRNEQTERLVDCSDKELCVTREMQPSGVAIAIFPSSCPVFRRSP